MANISTREMEAQIAYGMDAGVSEKGIVGQSSEDGWRDYPGANRQADFGIMKGHSLSEKIRSKAIVGETKKVRLTLVMLIILIPWFVL